jgi:hypothetical protein
MSGFGLGTPYKYFGEQPGTGVPLHYPGVDGIPFRGTRVPLLRGNEAEELLVTVADFKTQRFRLWIPEEEAGYREVLDRVTNQRYVLLRDLEQWIPEHGDWVHRLYWCECFKEVTPGRTAGSGMAIPGTPPVLRETHDRTVRAIHDDLS